MKSFFFNWRNLLFMGLVSLLLISCGGGNGKGKRRSSSLLPSVTGTAFDVLVVGSQAYWKDTVGRALFDVLNQDMPGFFQSEPLFNIIFLKEPDFNGVMRPVRNIIFFDIDDAVYTQGKISYFKDRWASPQSIVRIAAPNKEEFLKVLSEKKDEMISYLVDAERKRSTSFYTKYSNRTLANKLKKALDVDMVVPSHIDKSRIEKDFIWMSNANIDMTQNIVVYAYPYNRKDDFKLKNLLAKRDSVMKKYIAGPTDGSYMTTEYRCDPYYREMTDEKGRYVVEIRGLWRVEGDVMGGPFVSRSYYDEKRGRVLTTETYLYGPNKKKRNIIRQLEAMIRTVDFD
ncbi:MAG TPA: DUF4837 family protein [Paludibacteraceae bacterium]|nr:DUF4837 family protein [Paludibacteraceae bacterium]HQF49620.1 DUF4837 family protein [Paludibacteraceae bacterium]HQJ89383.1 DUF4837 family protein [Paludibacteraceae bacterium]